MKNFIIKFLKIVLVFLLSTIITYNCFLVKNYFVICDEFQVGDMSGDAILHLDKEKIKDLGDSVRTIADLLEEDASKSNEERSTIYSEDGEVYSISDLYDPLGFSVQMQIEHIISRLFYENISISIMIGITVTFAYTVITMKKLNNVVKVLLGYLGVMIVFPPLCMYSWTGRFWELTTMYWYAAPKYFYVVYTLIFVVMYIINCVVSTKLTKQLNEMVKKQEKE